MAATSRADEAAMPCPDQRFLSLLRNEGIRDGLFAHLSKGDISSVRQASSACCNLVTKPLFTRVQVSFNATTFTKSSRVAALGRIGQHIEHLTFFLEHSEATFLAPLVHPSTGQEICFVYRPHTSMDSAMTRPKYANSELGDILTQQYPPLFHAATNVPSFINAFRALPNMRHLTIRCPGQDARERYRRDIVDYALVSVRIAVERNALHKLHKLSLSCVHPGAFSYLRHAGGLGAVPSSAKRWRQIRKLNISVAAWDFEGPSPGLDHLKIIDDYVRFFAPHLEKFGFSWVGAKGPCAVSLSGDALFTPPRSSKKLFHEVTSPMSPLPTPPPREPVRFPVLRSLHMRNVAMAAPQLSRLIKEHRKTVKEFSFENVALVGNHGTWDDALSPLHDDSWSQSQSQSQSQPRPRSRSRRSAAAESEPESASECSFVSNESTDSLAPASAAVQAASRELLDLDLGAMGFSDDEDRHVIDELSEQITAAARGESLKAAGGSGFTAKLKRKKKQHSGSGSGSGSRHRRHRKRSHSSPSAPSCSTPSVTMQPPPPLTRASSAKSSRSAASAASAVSNISAPIHTAEPPVILQPTVYDPTARPDSISAVQRNIEQEEAHRLLAQDANACVTALAKAKAAVLAKLSREFCAKQRSKNGAVAACRLMASRQGMPSDLVVPDDRALESQTALVPLMFSR